jgi:hypothetical protein
MKKILAYVFLFSMFSLVSEATVVRGSVPNRGEKRFTIVPDFSGTILIHLIYDNNNSDLDLELGYTNEDGDIQLVAVSQSTLRNFEQIELGVLGGLEYNIFIVSDHGSSPFRANIDGTFTTTSGARVSAPLVLQERSIDASSKKFLEEMRKRREAVKGKMK